MPTPAIVSVQGLGSVEVTYSELGAGRPYLLLHGGAGPQSVAAFAELLAASGAQVLTPTHPGFGGTARPAALDSVTKLATLYAGLLDTLDLTDVVVIGNSIGGWIAAELALLGSPRVGALVLVDAVGIEVAGHPVADFFSLTMDELTDLSFFAPEKFRVDLAALPPAAKAAMAGNRDAIGVYAGSMVDGGLRDRLGGISVPSTVLWGEADGVVDVEYGRTYAAAIPGASFGLLTGAGHVPQVEAPQDLLDAITGFVGHPGLSVVGPDAGEIAFAGPIQMRIIEDGSNTQHRLGVDQITSATPPTRSRFC